MAGRATPFAKSRSRTVPDAEHKAAARIVEDYEDMANPPYHSNYELLQYIAKTLTDLLYIQNNARQFPQNNWQDKLTGVRANFNNGWLKLTFTEKLAAIKIVRNQLQAQRNALYRTDFRLPGINYQLQRLDTLARTTKLAHKVYKRKPFASTNTQLPEAIETKIAEYVGSGIANGFF